MAQKMLFNPAVGWKVLIIRVCCFVIPAKAGIYIVQLKLALHSQLMNQVVICLKAV